MSERKNYSSAKFENPRCLHVDTDKEENESTLIARTHLKTTETSSNNITTQNVIVPHKIVNKNKNTLSPTFNYEMYTGTPNAVSSSTMDTVTLYPLPKFFFEPMTSHVTRLYKL